MSIQVTSDASSNILNVVCTQIDVAEPVQTGEPAVDSQLARMAAKNPGQMSHTQYSYLARLLVERRHR